MAQMETIMPMNESAPNVRVMIGRPGDLLLVPALAAWFSTFVSRFASAMYLLLILRITTPHHLRWFARSFVFCCGHCRRGGNVRSKKRCEPSGYDLSHALGLPASKKDASRRRRSAIIIPRLRSRM